VEYTWDAYSIFPSDEDWEDAFAGVQELLEGVTSCKGRLHENPSVLADYMDALESLIMSVGKIYVYASMFHSVDTADQEAVAKNDRARSLFSQTMAAISFAEPELLAIGFDTLRKWLKDEPRLAIYEHYLDDLQRRQAHVRSAEIEQLLGMVTDAFSTAAATHGILADADLTFEPAQHSDTLQSPETVAQGTINALLTSPDRALRRTAWQYYADSFIAHKNTMASCLSAGVKQNVFHSQVRRYNSALEASLSANNIPVEVYHNTVETYRRNLPTWHRYWRVRKRALGFEQLFGYDVRAPLTNANHEVPFDQAVEWILAGMSPLGHEYQDVMGRGLRKERWVDVFPNENKRSGAFSTGFKGTHPFILMNYNDDLNSMSVLAHELGHSMHSYYSEQNQPLIYADYSIFVAEVASNFNQALVRAYLLEEHSDTDFQIAVIEEAMSNFHRYFFIMPTLARFELEIHERVEKGQALTAENLSELMADLFEEGFGGEVEIDRERVGIIWAQFPTHLYANFYVYQYTTGISGAHALAADVLAGTPGVVGNYLAFLSAGSSLFPLDALKLAGVDMASPEPVEKTFGVLAGMVDRLEELTSPQS
jgi:oligoendopeptidase F